MDAILFPGRLRPGKRSASIGRRLYNYLAPYSYLASYSSDGCASFPHFKIFRERKWFDWQKVFKY